MPRGDLYSLRITSPATEEAVSLWDAKDHMRVSSSHDDTYILGLVKGAREHIENRTRRALVTTTFRLSLEEFPHRPHAETIELPRSPLASTDVTVTYHPSSGGSQTMPSTDFFVDDEAEPPRVVLKDGANWPSDTLRSVNGVEISFKAGYGPSSDVPQALKHAVLLLAGHWYQQREGVVVGSAAQVVPFAVDALIGGYRVPAVP